MTLYRAYDAGKARWLSRDPLLLGGGSLNFYTYAANDPINFTDPLGTKHGHEDPCEKAKREVQEALALHIAEEYAKHHHLPFPSSSVAAVHIIKAAEGQAN